MALEMPCILYSNGRLESHDDTLQPPGCKYGQYGQLVGQLHGVGWLPQASAPCDSQLSQPPWSAGPDCSFPQFLVILVPFQPRLALSGSDTNWSRLSLARQDFLWSTLISEGISSLL